MRKIILLFILTVKVFVLSAQNNECERLLDKATSIKDFTNSLEQFKRDFRIIASCKFDTIDYLLYMGPENNMNHVEFILNWCKENNVENIQFKDLVNYLNKGSKRRTHLKARKMIIVRNKVFQNQTSIKNWQKDSILLKEMGFSEIKIKEIYKFVKIHQPKLYSEVLKIYSDSLIARKSRLKNNTKTIIGETDVTGIPAYKSYEKAVHKSKEENKYVLLYFNAYGSPNSKRMEKGTLSRKVIQEYIITNFILVDLKVDDRTKLKEDDIYFSETLNKNVVNIGNINLELREGKYSSNRQPLFVILNSSEEEIGRIGYTEKTETFEQFLKQIEK